MQQCRLKFQARQGKRQRMAGWCGRLLAGAGGLVIGLVSAAAAQEVGQVVAVREPTTLRIGTQNVAQLTPQDRLTVLGASAESPQWLWVRVEKSGWVLKDRVQVLRDDGGGSAPSGTPSTAAQSQFLAGWMAGANASLIHSQILLLADLIDLDARQSDRVADKAVQLVQHCDRSIDKLTRLTAFAPAVTGVSRLQELYGALRAEALALEVWANEGTESASRQFRDAVQQVNSLLDSSGSGALRAPVPIP